jgi:hypothetical protein
MTPETEQKLLETIYSNIEDFLTFRPPGRMSAFDKETTLVQINTLGQVLNPDDFKNLISPINPNGDILSTELFSRMVDVIPPVSAQFVPTSGILSSTYKSIVEGANSSVSEDTRQKVIYDKAWDYLHDTVRETDFMGNTVEREDPSRIAANYDANQGAYVAAYCGYRSAYNGYDLTDPVQQRQWLAQAPMLELVMTQAYNKWRQEGAALVEQARAALDTTINSSIRTALADARRNVAEERSFPSAVMNQPRWYLAYANPNNWANPAAKNYGSLHIKSSRLVQTSNERFRSYGGGASFFGGLFRIGGGVSGGSSERHYHMEANEFEINAEILVVSLNYPHINGAIFKMKNWFTDAARTNGISNGKLEGNKDNVLPLIPRSLVVARGVNIRANWSQRDLEIIREQLRAGGGLCIGPFCLGGRYSSSKTETSFTAEEKGQSFIAPGLQVIAWISEIVPPCPPQDTPR